MKLSDYLAEWLIKQQTWEPMRQRNGDAWVEEHARFLEHQWELGIVDEETHLGVEG